MPNKIGIVLIATNAYFILGIRFIKKFIHHYKGDCEIKFYFFSEEDPRPYLAVGINAVHKLNKHLSWIDATNSKFKNILDIQKDLLTEVDYVYYFDADTNISQRFDESWFLGDLVGGEHFGSTSFLKDGIGFDKNPESKAYVPDNTTLLCTYYYGAFFGGKTNKVIDFCNELRSYQLADKEIGYEPSVNDESYINKYFHYNPPTLTVESKDFKFDISDKGGIGETRNPELNIRNHKKEILKRPNDLFNIQNNTITWL